MAALTKTCVVAHNCRKLYMLHERSFFVSCFRPSRRIHDFQVVCLTQSTCRALSDQPGECVQLFC